MELAEELSFRHCELKLQWIRRDINQLADDLTNEKFDVFVPGQRIVLTGGELEWRVLDKLLKGADSFFQEVRSHKETKLARFQKGTKRRRLDPCMVIRLRMGDG